MLISPKSWKKGINVKCYFLFINFILETSFQYPGEDPSQISCATCHLAAKGSLQVFSGRVTCPDEWDHIYDGLLMSSSMAIASTTFVCLDKNANKNTTITSGHPLIPNWTVLAGEKNENDGQIRRLFPCVVCAK